MPTKRTPATAKRADRPAPTADRSTSNTPRYWLVKSEPTCFSFDQLMHAPRQTTGWDGVRNYQARNFMRDEMRVGDGVLYYHSNAEPPAIVGFAEVASAPYPDPTQFDPDADHFDPKSDEAAPIWMQVDIRGVEPLPEPLSLEKLRRVPGLEKMELLRKGSRLSVQPVTPAEWEVIRELAARG